ncbi:hypothetical protein [Streptomyces sp. NPDC055189]
MSTAQHLAAIDLLRSREFPVEHGRSDDGDGGPGYRIAELLTSDDFWDADITQVEAAADQYEAERDGLSVLLAERWGAPQIFSLASVLERAQGDGYDSASEDIPEPWGTLSSSVPDLHLWRADGRWIALGVSQWDRELPFQLLAVVTEIDPP